MTTPAEAVAAIKLTRADAVKLVAGELRELYAGDVAECEKDAAIAARKFRDRVVLQARHENSDQMKEAADLVGVEEHELCKTCTYRVYEDGTDSGDVAQVVFSDHQQTFEAKLRVAVNVKLNAGLLDWRDDWTAALINLKNARERDLRAGAMKKEARDLLIKEALADRPEGHAVVAAIKALSLCIKNTKSK